MQGQPVDILVFFTTLTERVELTAEEKAAF